MYAAAAQSLGTVAVNVILWLLLHLDISFCQCPVYEELARQFMTELNKWAFRAFKKPHAAQIMRKAH